MLWTNWQGAIWRGAVLVVLFWTGLAWTQTSTPRPADPADKIMVVHENGKATRCRVLETWRMPDGRVAHLLQALETGEMITIVDEPGAVSEMTQNPRAMPKRIFAWGQRRQSPEGAPVPPHMQIDSGIVIKNEALPPVDATPVAGPVILNGGAEEKLAKLRQPPILNRMFPKHDKAMEKPVDTQIVEINEPAPKKTTTSGPAIVNEQPLPPIVIPTQGTPKIETPAEPLPSVPLPLTSTPIENPNLGPKIPAPQAKPVETAKSSAVECDPFKKDECRPLPAAKKGWRPGANIQAWLQGKPKTEIVKAPKWEEPKAEVVKKEEVKKPKIETQLVDQSKVAEKQLQEKIDKIYGAPFSTAKAPQPDIKKPEPAPLAIPNTTAKNEKPLVMPPAPKSEDLKPVTMPPAPKDEGTKTASLPPPLEKKDMWGTSMGTLPTPGKTLLDPAALKPEMVKLPAPPLVKANDPLLSPEKLIPKDDKLAKKVANLPLPGAVRPTENTTPAGIPEFKPNTTVAPPANWPIGTQSVQAAHSGLLGAPMYIPVPTVTVPAPNNPPQPPAPNVPEAPQLNAYVNAFSPPPAPKTAQPSMQPMNAMMPQQMPYPNPMMTQQQMMMWQQAMAQQQMMHQQQILMQYGYRPSPALMYPYLAQQTPSAGPMQNYSRHYAGPLPPNPTGMTAMQSGFAPMPYPASMPMHTMMPTQPPLTQPVAYNQPQPVPTQQQSVTQQVEQLIKVMRESPYPAQREWAAQSLASFEWRAHPQIVPALIQSASQDPAATVRAGCVHCLGRMNAAVEPVFGVLHSMRNDIDPRVRQEVEQAFIRLGQAPMAQ